MGNNVDFSWNKYADKKFIFDDERLVDAAKAGDEVGAFLAIKRNVVAMVQLVNTAPLKTFYINFQKLFISQKTMHKYEKILYLIFQEVDKYFKVLSLCHTLYLIFQEVNKFFKVLSLYHTLYLIFQEVDKYFKVLSLCHTVMSEDNDGVLTYQAQSPDEEALLTAARNFGYVFIVSTTENLCKE